MTIIARLWSNVVIRNSFVYIAVKLSKLKNKIYSSYGAVFPKSNTQLQEDKFEAVCQILIEKHDLKKLNSPFSGHSIFLQDENNHIWEIDKTDTSVNEVRVKKPDSTIYDQVMEFNGLSPKLIHHKTLIQKDQLASMNIDIRVSANA